MKNFPIGEDGIAITATQASAATLISAGLRDTISEDVLVDNPGPFDVYITAGGASAVATDLSMRVPAGSMQPFNKGTTTHLAVKTKTGSGQTQAIVVHVGEGQ